MLQYAKEKKVAEKIEMLTNGILLTAELIESLPQVLSRIIISIEGLCLEDYQRIAGVNIDFQNLLDNLDVLYASRGNCIIHIKIHNSCILCESKKTEFLNMFGCRCDEIYIENLIPMWPQLDSAYFTNEFRWKERAITKRRICAQIFKGIQVQADGEVVPCCVDWKRVNVIGDLNKNSLFEIWNGERLRKLQIEHLMGNKSKTEPCKDCTMNDYCEYDNIDLYAEQCLKRLCR
jgi:radical SAM protein with 4Fe4S-binding SPASM domain